MRPTLLLLAALAATACKDDAPQTKLPRLGDALPKISLPRNSSMVSYAGSEEALSLLYRSAAPRAEVEDFYRTLLSREPWQLVSEGPDNEGATVFHAKQDGPPLWVRVWPDTAFNATFIRLSGAVRKLEARGGTGEATAPAP
jgi:hypothetical protein